jgi:hypothetical protein
MGMVGTFRCYREAHAGSLPWIGRLGWACGNPFMIKKIAAGNFHAYVRPTHSTGPAWSI